MIKCFLLFTVFIFTSCSTTYYVVRHAEKEVTTNMMTSDVPLSAAGKERAEALKSNLQSKKIRHIYSTNYIRTKGTAQSLSDAIGIPIQTYDPRDTAFVNKIKNLGKGNVLIVGHSNTVDDIINRFTGKPTLQDLPDTQYGDIFIIRKKGDKYTYSKERFGQ